MGSINGKNSKIINMNIKKRSFAGWAIFSPLFLIALTQGVFAQTWTEAIEESAPAYWWRFEETSVFNSIPNEGSAGACFQSSFSRGVPASGS
jgi:hypothetical protein